MILKELEAFDQITIQCHDNPDPDAIASGFALYEYYKKKGKEVRFVYAGKNKMQKPNLLLMVDKLEIPIEYLKGSDLSTDGLLITVDCQYGEGNVTEIKCGNVACIDHHVVSGEYEHACIRPFLGSCSTLVWSLMKEAKIKLEPDVEKRVNTALFYGLMTDTGNFTELRHPVDRDMWDALVYDKSLIALFCNSNLSIDELEIAGIALIKNIYDKNSHSLIIHSNPCDPNILGLISDLALQVAGVDVCVVYNEIQDGFKLSVRSCTKEVHANELADFLTQGIGSGGGHRDKAGGFIKKKKLNEILHHGETSEAFLGNKLTEYFNSSVIIYTKDYEIDTTDMEMYKKREDLILGYADPTEFLKEGTQIVIRTLEGDVSQTVSSDFYIMIGLEGEVYPIKRRKFEKSYKVLKGDYEFNGQYSPVIHVKDTEKSIDLVRYTHPCQVVGTSYVLAEELQNTVKVFTMWDEEKYYLGKPGDFIACQKNDHKDVYVIQRDIFFKTYEKCGKKKEKEIKEKEK